MARAVQFDEYGPVDVLHVVDVEAPAPAPGQVVVRVAATSINPGEIMIREGAMDEGAPAVFPSGQGSDLAGTVVDVGAEVTGWTAGDEVFGWTDERAAQSELVAVPAGQLARRPAGVPVEQAASLYVAGGTAYGMVDAVAAQVGETVAVSAAAGGVGSIAVQLLRQRGARVLGIAGTGNAEWLAEHGVEPIEYGDGLGERLRAAAPSGIGAFLDCYGDGYVALAVELGVAPERVATIIDFASAGEHGARVVFGHQTASAQRLADLAALIDQGELTIPIAATYPLEEVRAAYGRLAQRRTRGKIVLTT